MEKLFTSYTVGDTTIQTRIVMAPMTRSRAREGDIADNLTAKYYRAPSAAYLTKALKFPFRGRGIFLRLVSTLLHR